MEVEDIVPNVYEDNDDFDSEEDVDVTYESICIAVREEKPRSEIRKLVCDYQPKKYESMDYLDDITYDLWVNVMVPYMENHGGILDKDREEIRRAFGVWLYENTNLGRQIAYICQLEKVLNI
jgi:hypothetical protein